MKIGVVSALLVLSGVGCATAIFTGPSGASTSDPLAGPPHALGTVELGESHAAGASSVMPSVTASFIPDTTNLAKKSCATTVSGCEITSAPKCSTTCTSGQLCSYDDACNATCTTPKKACTMSCSAGEECYFPTLDGPSACRKKPTFDSGAITFSGTSVPITLLPPYTYSQSQQGSLFLAGSKITAQAAGAESTGFKEWQAAFSGTSLMQTSLSNMEASDFFGSGGADLSWTPGHDNVTINLSGLGGAASCKVSDADGKFTIPRAVIDAAAGGASTISISVMRDNLQIVRGLGTTGTLVGETVQPQGWLVVGTTSTESKSIQGCSNGGAMCSGQCISTMSDPENCGGCGQSCAGASCVQGQCSTPSTGTDTCDSCWTTSQSTACSSQTSTCGNDSQCTGLSSCLQNCSPSDTTCGQNCADEFPDGVSELGDLQTCLCNACTACANQPACGG